MAKKNRTSRPPAGSFLPARTPARLYESREDYVSSVALRSRGCPNPDNAIVVKRRSSTPRKARRQATPAPPAIPFGFVLENAQRAMLAAQAAVRTAKAEGRPYAELATVARARRAEYLALTGDAPQRRTIEVSQGSESNPVKAV